MSETKSKKAKESKPDKAEVTARQGAPVLCDCESSGGVNVVPYSEEHLSVYLCVLLPWHLKIKHAAEL